MGYLWWLIIIPVHILLSMWTTKMALKKQLVFNYDNTSLWYWRLPSLFFPYTYLLFSTFSNNRWDNARFWALGTAVFFLIAAGGASAQSSDPYGGDPYVQYNVCVQGRTLTDAMLICKPLLDLAERRAIEQRQMYVANTNRPAKKSRWSWIGRFAERAFFAGVEYKRTDQSNKRLYKYQEKAAEFRRDETLAALAAAGNKTTVTGDNGAIVNVGVESEGTAIHGIGTAPPAEVIVVPVPPSP